MKILFTFISLKLVVILVLIFSLSFLFSNMPNTFAAGGYPCFFSIAPLEKQVYQPGETVTIRAVDCHPEGTDQANLVIADGMTDLSPGSRTLDDYEHGKNVIYKESKPAGPYGIAEFNFTIPQSPSTYRYVILLEPYGTGGYGMSFFFTKPDADKIKISNVQILNPNVNQGDILKIGATITDGLGSPLPFFDFDATTNYRGCFPDHPIANEVRPYEMSDADRQNYFTTGIAWNWIQIPQGYPGTYSLNLTADIGGYEVENGFAPAAVSGLQYNVLGNTTIKNEMHLYPHYYKPDSIPSVNEDPDVSPSPEDNHLIDYSIGDPLYLTAHSIHSGCVSFGDPLPVTVTVKKMQLDTEKASHLFGQNPVNYHSNISCYLHPEICSVVSENSTKFGQHPSDWFGIEQTLNTVENNPGEYLVYVNGSYHNIALDNAVDIRSHNIKEFHINAEGKDFSMFVDNWFSALPANATFNEQNKSMKVSLDTSANPKIVDLLLPYELLDGHLTVLINGEKVLEGNDNNTYGMITNELSYSHITLFPNTNHTDITIIGTSAVPEFPVPQVIITIAILGIILTTYLRLPYALGRISR